MSTAARVAPELPSISSADDYRPDVDGLRAIAVLTVLAFHAFPNYCPGGFVGVDVFFVISGFLISSIILRGLDRRSFTLRAFYARRIRRIFPSMIVVLAAFLALGWRVLIGYEYQQVAKHTVASSAFIANLAFWRESGYFDTQAALKPLLHLWSLGVEEQFYLFWPAFLLLFYKLGTRLLWPIALVAAASFASNVAIIRDHASAAFYLPFTRLWEPVAGALLAWVLLRSSSLPLDRTIPVFGARVSLRNLAATAGALGVVISLSLLTRQETFPGWLALAPVSAAVLLLAAGSGAWINRKILAHPILVWIGLVSYPLYLWHWPLLAFTRILASGVPTVLARCVVLALSFALAAATYQFVEKPVRFSPSRFVPAALLLVMLMVGGCGYWIYANDGFPARIPAQAATGSNNESFRALVNSFPKCPDAFGGVFDLTFCRISNPRIPTAAIFGDSHADHLFPGIARADPGRTWLLIGETSCAPMQQVRSFRSGLADQCLENNARILNVLLSSPSISTVVLAANAAFYIGDGETYGPENRDAWSPANWRMEPATPDGQPHSKKSLLEFGLDNTIRALEGAHKQVVFFIDSPAIPFLPADCGRRFRIGFDPVCAIDRDYVAQQQKDYRDVIARLEEAHPKMWLFDSVEHLCPKSTCDLGPNAAYYRDGHHLSAEGSDHLAQSFIPWLDSRRP